MAQGRGLHRGPVGCGQEPGVTGHEPDQQPARALVQVAGGGPPDPGTQPLGRPRRRSPGLQTFDPGDVEQHAGMLLRQPSAVPAVGQRSRAGRGAPPIPEGWRHRDPERCRHRDPERGGPRPPERCRPRPLEHQRGPLAHRGPRDPVDPDEDVPAASDRPRLGHHRQLHGHAAALGGERGQHPRGGRIGPQDDAPRRRRGDHRQREDPARGTETVTTACVVREREQRHGAEHRDEQGERPRAGQRRHERRQ